MVQKEIVLVCHADTADWWRCHQADYLIETRIMAKIRYFPKSGTTSDVGGMISTTKRKNTYKLVKMEMESVTCDW